MFRPCRSLPLLASALLCALACSSTPPTAEVPAEATEPVATEPAAPPLPTPIVSTGYMHQCCVAKGDRVLCNGSNNNDEISVPDVRFVAVSAGLYATCAIDTDGKPHCWGKHAPTIADGDAMSLSRIATGSKFACALTSKGELTCFSDDDFPTPPTGTFRDVVAGWDHACALAESGEVACFGRPQREPIACTDLENADGARCEGKTMVPRSWTAAPKGLRAKTIAAGASHACALSVAGKVVCWGSWGHGDGNTIWSNQLFPPDSLGGDIRKLTGGGGSSCALHADGKTTCWGDQKDLPGEFIDIDGGALGTCGVRKDGAMECFTYGSFAGAKLDTTPLRCATEL